MDDYSPVTFNSSLDSKLDEPDEPQNTANSSVDYIEESKFVVNGIKVRAAKLPKLVKILVESFGMFIFLKS